jgi:SET domain-containing protein
LGLFTKEDIGEDKIIIELIGRRVAAVEVDILEKLYQGISIKEYFLFMVNKYNIINCIYKSNTARFTNYSCKSNIEVRIIKFRGKNYIIYFLLYIIKKGIFPPAIIRICG